MFALPDLPRTMIEVDATQQSLFDRDVEGYVGGKHERWTVHTIKVLLR